MRRALRRPRLRLLAKGQDDHVDAWLMSYADMITLLFMFFVIFVSVSVSQQQGKLSQVSGEPEHPYIEERSGALALKGRYSDVTRTLIGIIAENRAEQDVSIEEKENGITLDASTPLLFLRDKADIRDDAKPLLARVAASLKQAPDDSSIEVGAYTDDAPPDEKIFANNWELSAMRAARIVTLLIGEGVDATKLRAMNYAGNRPAVPNIDARGNPIPENRTRNRRIVIRVTGAPRA